MRVAFASIAWKTKPSSPGELEMTLQYLRSRCLPLKRFAQLVEQPRVLDRDDSLRGEVLDQVDLFVGEGADLLTVDGKCANQLTFLEHWNGND